MLRELAGEEAPEKPASTLRQRLHVGRGEELLASTVWQDRVRGIDRLGADGSKEAVTRLVEALAPGSAVRADPRSRLAAVRALAPHVRRTDVRRRLIAVVEGEQEGVGDAVGATPHDEDELALLSRETAALALALRGGEADVTPLITAVILGGRNAAVARAALIAHRPRALAPFIRGYKYRLSAPVAELLGDLGDVRAIAVLRHALRRHQPALQAAAAVALAKLGDGSAAPQARSWLAGASSRRLRLAAAETLVVLAARDAARAVAELLADPRTRADAMNLAERLSAAELVPALGALIRKSRDGEERRRAAALIARIGGVAAVDVLTGLLAAPELATTAALGLATIPHDSARVALERALAAVGDAAARRLVLRAAIARRYRLHDAPHGLVAALEAALVGRDPRDRAVAAFGLVLGGDRSLERLLTSPHPEVVQAAARAALAMGDEALAALAVPLARAAAAEEPGPLGVACGAALYVAGDAIGASVLARWAEQGGPLGPQAARLLAQRDPQLFRDRLLALLGGSDPLVRAHVALGLGDSPERDAAAILADGYRFEADAAVRRALVRALSRRSERRREATLRLARDLDPDPGVRALARSALGGIDQRPTAEPGDQVLWVALRVGDEHEQWRVNGRAAQLVRGDGLSLPVVADPDGVIFVAGLPSAGHVALRLAPRADSDKPSRDGRASTPRQRRRRAD
jgi:hypothetical protein